MSSEESFFPPSTFCKIIQYITDFIEVHLTSPVPVRLKDEWEYFRVLLQTTPLDHTRIENYIYIHKHAAIYPNPLAEQQYRNSEEMQNRESQNDLFKKQFAQNLLNMYSNYLSSGGVKDPSSKIPLINSVTMLISPRPGTKEPVIHSDDQVIIAAARELEKLKADTFNPGKTHFTIEETPELILPSATLKAKFERNLKKGKQPAANRDCVQRSYQVCNDEEFSQILKCARDELYNNSQDNLRVVDYQSEAYNCTEEEFKIPFSNRFNEISFCGGFPESFPELDLRQKLFKAVKGNLSLMNQHSEQLSLMYQGTPLNNEFKKENKFLSSLLETYC